MKPSISVTDAQRNFADYINRVVYRGEHFLLVRGGKPVAELSPVPSGLRLTELPALLDSLPRLGEEEAEAFGHDLEQSRSELAGVQLRDPWGS